MRWTAWLVLVGGCRIGFDPLPDHVAAGDPFSPPRLVPELSSPNVDDDPTLTGDLLELYFTSSRGGNQDIFRATRGAVTDPWNAPQVVPELSSTASDEGPGVRADGLEIYFSSNRAGGTTSRDIYRATRATRQDMWSVPAVVPELTVAANENQPEVGPSELRLVLHRRVSGSIELFEATRGTVNATWNAPVALATLSTASGEGSPCLADDELVLVFASDRGNVSDVQDLYIAERASLAGSFALVRELDELDTPFDEDSPWLSNDGRVLYFGSDRSGDIEIYEAVR